MTLWVPRGYAVARTSSLLNFTDLPLPFSWTTVRLILYVFNCIILNIIFCLVPTSLQAAATARHG